mmetsp:Transcript_120698/g.341306  ORF Transcript_120698/g.341306 Transcript_120698/m.341306 type:complete len:400 (+) Transcript_120698:202-1401(+)
MRESEDVAERHERGRLKLREFFPELRKTTVHALGVLVVCHPCGKHGVRVFADIARDAACDIVQVHLHLFRPPFFAHRGGHIQEHGHGKKRRPAKLGVRHPLVHQHRGEAHGRSTKAAQMGGCDVGVEGVFLLCFLFHGLPRIPQHILERRERELGVAASPLPVGTSDARGQRATMPVTRRPMCTLTTGAAIRNRVAARAAQGSDSAALVAQRRTRLRGALFCAEARLHVGQGGGWAFMFGGALGCGFALTNGAPRPLDHEAPSATPERTPGRWPYRPSILRYPKVPTSRPRGSRAKSHPVVTDVDEPTMVWRMGCVGLRGDHRQPLDHLVCQQHGQSPQKLGSFPAWIRHRNHGRRLKLPHRGTIVHPAIGVTTSHHILPAAPTLALAPARAAQAITPT